MRNSNPANHARNAIPIADVWSYPSCHVFLINLPYFCCTTGASDPNSHCMFGCSTSLLYGDRCTSFCMKVRLFCVGSQFHCILYISDNFVRLTSSNTCMCRFETLTVPSVVFGTTCMDT